MTENEDDGAVRVLVIGGWGRCGSTVLDMLLGQVAGWVSAGEIRELWLRGCRENRPCGCGRSFHSCPFWTAVGDHAFGGWDELDLDRILRIRYSLDRPWRAPDLLLDQWRSRRSADLAAYTDALGRLLRGIKAVSGARVVVDSSKLPTHTMILARTQGLDVRLLHLVRDPRGVAFSNRKTVMKQVTTGAPSMLPRHGALGSSSRYDVYNGLTSLLSRSGLPYLLLRYEDLIEGPEKTLRAVLAHAGAPEDADLGFLTGNSATLAENHLVDGNPVRFSQGPLALRVDDAWRRELPQRERRLVSALTYPLLAAYRYPLR